MGNIDDDLEQARKGSTEALSCLLGRYRNLLLWTAQKALGSDVKTKVGASDVVQETLLEAYRDFELFRGESDVQWQAWLRQILANNLANVERRYRQTKKRSIGIERSMDADSAVRSAAELATLANPAESTADMKGENAAALRVALLTLPENYRQVLAMRYQQQLPFEEIATRMGRSTNAVRKLWARAC